MSNDRTKERNEYWNYLQENSKVVAEWPKWLKRDRDSSDDDMKCGSADSKNNENR